MQIWQISKNNDEPAWVKDLFSAGKLRWHQYFETKLEIVGQQVYGDFGDVLVAEKEQLKIVKKADFEVKKE